MFFLVGYDFVSNPCSGTFRTKEDCGVQVETTSRLAIRVTLVAPHSLMAGLCSAGLYGRLGSVSTLGVLQLACRLDGDWLCQHGDGP